MIVVVAGMPRSGSTWSFNVAQLALGSKRQSPRTLAADSLPADADMFIRHPCRHLILKSHFPDGTVLNLLKRSEVVGLATVRDPVDASKSWGRVFSEAPDPVPAWLEWHQAYKGLFLEIPFAEVGS